MEKSKKALPFMLAAALATTPFLSAPKAFAISDVSVSAEDDDVEAEDEYTISFSLEEGLEDGDYIYIEFESDFDISDSIDENDIEADGFDVDSVNVDDNTIEIKVDGDIDADDDLEIVITDGITNPDDDGEYTVEVYTDNDDEDTDTDYVEIGDGGSSGSDDFTVDVSDEEEDADARYTIEEFDLDTDLEEYDEIVVTFPDSDMLPDDIDTDDVEINGEEPDDVEVDGDEVTITVPYDVEGDDTLEIEFLSGADITNPEAGDYTIEIDHEGDYYESEEFEITEKSGSSSTVGDSSFSVSLSDTAAAARSSYSFQADFGKKELKAGDELIVEFPSTSMVPGILSTSDITINGKAVSKASAFGGKVYLTAPGSFSTDSDLKVVFNYGAWITNPKTAGSYQLKMTVDGKTITSSSFTISGSSTAPTPTPNPPVVNPTPVNNTTATIVMGKATLNTVSGLVIDAKALGVPLAKNRDFIEVVMPAGFKVPPYIAPANASVNGVLSSYVAVRGNNVLVYPAQDVPAGVATRVVIGTSSGIVTPSVKNVYSIAVYSSEEKGVLFARPVSIGGAPLPKPPVQAPASTIPANAATVKLNVANYGLHGKFYPLTAAPYAANNTTMVPAQFFREALFLTTNWNNQTVAIISGMKVIKFTAGSNQVRVGNNTVTLPAPVQWKNGVPMLPLKLVADNLGYKTGVDAKTGTIYVYK